MSSILGITKSLVWDKFKFMNMILLGNLICLLIIIVVGIANPFNSRYPQGLMNLTYGIVFIVGVLGLVLMNEKILGSNRYRLIPVSNWGLYAVNIVTTIVNFLYLLVIETSILACGYFFNNGYFFNKRNFGQEIYHILGWRHGAEVQVFVGRAHQAFQLGLDDLHECLARGQATRDFGADRTFLDAVDEILDHRQGNVGLEQGHAHFAQRVLDVVFGQLGLAGDMAQRL